MFVEALPHSRTVHIVQVALTVSLWSLFPTRRSERYVYLLCGNASTSPVQPLHEAWQSGTLPLKGNISTYTLILRTQTYPASHVHVHWHFKSYVARTICLYLESSIHTYWLHRCCTIDTIRRSLYAQYHPLTPCANCEPPRTYPHTTFAHVSAYYRISAIH